MEYTIWSSSFKAIWWMDLKLFRVRAPSSDWGPIHNKDCCQVQGLNYGRLLAKQATVLYTSSPSLLPPPQLKRNKWAESTLPKSIKRNEFAEGEDQACTQTLHSCLEFKWRDLPLNCACALPNSDNGFNAINANKDISLILYLLAKRS